MKKRILAVILCVAMLLSVVPFTLTAGATADDGIAGYWMDVLAEEKFMTYEMGCVNHGSTRLCMTNNQDPFSEDATYTYGGSSGLYIRENEGEYFVIFNPNEVPVDKEDSADYGKIQESNGAIYPHNMSGWTRGKGLPEGVERTGLTHLAIRIRVTGGEADQYSSWGLQAGGGHGFYNMEEAYLIDKDGKVIDPNFRGIFAGFTGEFDGWIVMPFSNMSAAQQNWITTDADGIIVWFHSELCPDGHGKDVESDWENRILWMGDMAVINDEAKFLETYSVPTTADDGISGYWMDVLAEEKWMRYEEGATSGSAQISMIRDQDPFSQDAQYTQGGNSGVYIRENEGEYFVILNPKEDLDDSGKPLCREGAIYPNPLSGRGTYTSSNRGKGLPADVDTTGFSHLAIRIRVTGGDAEQYSAFDIHLGGAGTRTLNLENGYFIDNNTKIATSYTEATKVLGFTGEVNGWLVFPVDDDQKAWVTTNGDGFTVRFHAEACGHKVSGSSWLNKVLWFGDMAVVTNIDKFLDAYSGGSECDMYGHLGGKATCKDPAVCDICGEPYGEVDLTNHGENTEIRDVETPSCSDDGFTGNTYCLDCNTILVEGKVIPATGEHVDADEKWEIDETTHFHTCKCGEVFDAGKHQGGEATCVAKAVCDTCKEAYGEVNANNHKNTEVRDAEDAKCGVAGYTGDTWCLDCDTKIETGKVIDALEHKGGEATCTKKAVCELCEEEYGEVNADNHKNTEVKNKKDATCEAEGYTGDTWCKDCEKEVAKGKTTDKLEHVAAAELKDAKPATTTEKGYTGDKVCKECGFVMEAGKEIPVLTTGGDSTNDENAGSNTENEGTTAPETGDNASILLAVLMTLMAGAVVVLAKKRAIEK